MGFPSWTWPAQSSKNSTFFSWRSHQIFRKTSRSKGRCWREASPHSVAVLNTYTYNIDYIGICILQYPNEFNLGQLWIHVIPNCLSQPSQVVSAGPEMNSFNFCPAWKKMAGHNPQKDWPFGCFLMVSGRVSFSWSKSCSYRQHVASPMSQVSHHFSSQLWGCFMVFFDQNVVSSASLPFLPILMEFKKYLPIERKLFLEDTPGFY